MGEMEIRRGSDGRPVYGCRRPLVCAGVGVRGGEGCGVEEREFTDIGEAVLWLEGIELPMRIVKQVIARVVSGGEGALEAFGVARCAYCGEWCPVGEMALDNGGRWKCGECMAEEDGWPRR